MRVPGLRTSRGSGTSVPARQRKENHSTMKSIQRFLADERGLETVEYAIIAGLIVVGLIVVLASIGTKVKSKFDAIDSALT